MDLGGGAELIWPDRGLSLGRAGDRAAEPGVGRVGSTGWWWTLSYDFAGRRPGRDRDARERPGGERPARDATGGGIGMGRPSPPGAGGGAPGDLGGHSLGALLPRTEGLAAARRDADFLRLSLRGEIGYGLLAAPSAEFAGRGLLTPYARFDLAREGQLYATGLRFDSFGGARLGLEAGLDLPDAGGSRSPSAASPDYQLLFTGKLEF